MREIELKELKTIIYELLSQIKQICDQENLRYTLIGGTLLGAVRHKGFIPWDDDIDIAMPRKDYEKFIDYCVNHDVPFNLLAHEINDKYYNLYAKVCDCNTSLVEMVGNRSECEMGAYIDVFPIDSLGNNEKEAMRTMKRVSFKHNLLVAYSWKKFSPTKTNAWYINPVKFAFYLISRVANPKKLIKSIEATFINRGIKDYKYLGVVCGSYRNKEIFPAKIYSSYEDIEFEGENFSAITEHDYYLKQIYGDYMKLPPKNKQVTHHEFKIYSKF